MNVFLTLLLVAFVATSSAAPTTSSSPARWCVYSDAEEEKCNAMKNNFNDRNILPGIECIRALDKYDCMAKIERRDADAACFWSMDTYVAGRHHSLVPFLTEKHVDEDEWTYAYYSLAIIHRDDNTIHSLEDLRGKKSCHTGINRHVGWLYPTSQFVRRGFFQGGNCVNNAANMAAFFNSSCVSGVKNSAFDPDGRYDNLCALCGGEGEKFCSKEDPYAGYVGALKCLVDGTGDVAFVKDTTFGELVKERPEVAEKKDDYRLLCLDGSRKTLDEYKECNWGKIPERGCLTSSQTSQERIQEITNMLLTAQRDQSSFNMFESASYGGRSLIFGDHTRKLASVGNKNTYEAFLGDYMDVRNHQFVCNANPARWCTISEQEQAKCLRMRDAFAASFIKPDIQCVQEANTAECVKKIDEGKADLITLDGGDIAKSGRDYNVKVIANEETGEGNAKYYAIAVVKKDNQDISFNNLRGKKSCHTGIGRTAGWTIPVGALLASGQIERPTDCNMAKATGEFFSESCAPGALTPAYNPTGNNPASLCSLCAGTGEYKCSRTENEPYYGYTGAFHCMTSGAGDVAFVKHVTPIQNTDGKNQDEWAQDLRSQDFELLCKDGSRKSIEQYKSCNLARVASHGVVTSKQKTEDQLKDYEYLLKLGNSYYGNNTAFQLFKSGPGAKDLLFSDSTSILEIVDAQHRNYRNYLGTIYDIFESISPDNCHN